MGLRSCLLAFLSVLALASSYSIAHRSAAVGSFAGVPRTVTAQPRRVAPRSGTISMGKMAKFGIFSPAVYAAKAVLGEKGLNKLRGQGISLHSQVGCLAPSLLLPSTDSN